MAQPKETDTDTHTDINLNLKDFQLPPGYKPVSGHRGHRTSFTSTRTARHRNQKIEIKTTYRIKIDNKPLTLHTMVLDDGTVHCQGLPNYSFPSAIDLARSIIDAAGLASYDNDQIGDPNDDHHHDRGQHGSQIGHDGEDH